MTVTRRRRSGLQIVEWVLASLGLICLAWFGLIAIRAVQYQSQQSARLERAVQDPGAVRDESPTIERPASHENKPTHDLIGRLEIPRLHLSVMIVDGDDD